MSYNWWKYFIAVFKDLAQNIFLFFLYFHLFLVLVFFFFLCWLLLFCQIFRDFPLLRAFWFLILLFLLFSSRLFLLVILCTFFSWCKGLILSLGFALCGMCKVGVWSSLVRLFLDMNDVHQLWLCLVLFLLLIVLRIIQRYLAKWCCKHGVNFSDQISNI